MQEVRPEARAGFVQPASNTEASALGNREGGLFPAYDLLPTAPMTAYSSKTLPPPPLAHLNSISRISSPSPAILAVDDSLTIRKIIETILRREGYAVLTFPDGVTTLQWLNQARCPVPKLVLLDIGLPRIDGYELARTIKANPAWAEMTIVMVSQRDGVMDRLKGRLVGAKSYLAKPFKTQELVATVHQYLGSNGEQKPFFG